MFEEKACEFLISQGYKIIEQNFRFRRLGEIDIIAKDGEFICFIEVKARSTQTFGAPAEAVGESKRRRIRKLAEIYLTRSSDPFVNIRFDIVSIKFVKRIPDTAAAYNSITGIELIRNAF